MNKSKKHKKKIKHKRKIPKNKAENKKQHHQTVLYLAIVTVIFVSAAYITMNKTVSLIPEDKEAIKMTITMAGFDPNTLQVKVGEPVKINLINTDNQYHRDGGGFHNFILKGPGLDVNITVPPENQTVFAFTPTEPGEYDWYCDVCCGGKENPNMHGTLIVT